LKRTSCAFAITIPIGTEHKWLGKWPKSAHIFWK